MDTKLLAIALLAAAPLAASADAPSYRYAEVSYQFGGDIDVGFGSVDTDGFALEASFEIDDAWFVVFDYSSLSTDPSGLDWDGYAPSGGWHGEVGYVTIG